ncbi:MAG: NapC/NirT family cytochrome c [Bacteroidales bacterium]
MKLPKSVNNRLSLMGAILASISLLFIVFFFLISLFYDEGGNYLGLFTYIILPVFLIIGLILIPIGMVAKMRRMKRGKEPVQGKPWVIDFNDRRHRNATIIFGFGTIILVFLSGIGSYEAFHYTESVQFCGTTCHKVMEPEYTAYQVSEHANVACVECHVGEGADWYVRSKLSGLRQVWVTLNKSWPTPITTPIENLRPARETCERCHWPEKFYSHKLVSEKHFLADDDNTEWNIELRMRVAAAHSALGNTEGIHWHINPDIRIEYLDPANNRETLPWVRFINLATGDTAIFIDEENPVDEAALASIKPRVMDCMDCHTRPSHKYLAPQTFIDQAIAAGDIPSNLTGIKLASMEALTPMYENRAIAQDTIRKLIESFYRENHPDILETRAADVEKAITGILKGYAKNIFPEMKVSWDAYPDHIGHIEYEGCFRCHNDKHVSESGRVISRDCNLCHYIMLQGTPDEPEIAPFNGFLEFRHPVDIGDAWKEMSCAECHRTLY